MRHFPAPRWAYHLEQRLTALIKTTKEQIVSDLSDKITQVQTDVNDTGAALEQEIQQVKDAIAAGSVTPEDLAGLDAISAQLKNFTADAAADDATPPTP